MSDAVKPPRADVEVPLRYGAGAIVLRLPRRNLADIVRPRIPAASVPTDLAPSPAGAALRDVAAGRRALLLLPDGTRNPPPDDLMRSVLGALGTARSLRILIATGSHRPHTPGNRQRIDAVVRATGEAGLPPPRVVVHDCRVGPFTVHGNTARGTPIELSAWLDEADVFVAVADVKHHYFAGYSNPLKFFLPGAASFRAIEANHRLALDPDSLAGRHPFHPDPRRRYNPLAEDMRDAFSRAAGGRPAWAAVTVTAAGRTALAELAPIEEASGRAFAVADDLAAFDIPPGPRLVVSAGGAPQDATLYLAQRAIELTKAAAEDGAEILLLAECAEGIADHPTAIANFYDELARPLPDVLAAIRTGYRLYLHKAYKLAELLGRVRAVHLASRLDDDTVRRIHLVPAPSAQRVIDGWIAEDPDVPVTFFDEANRLCVRAAPRPVA